MSEGDMTAIFARGLLIAALFLLAHPAAADPAKIARGKYLVTIASCGDCHTPGSFFGKPDMNRYLGGSDVGFGIPGLGVFVGPNLTPDKETGLGAWSTSQIVRALTTGMRPDGRQLAPIMPWRAYAKMTAPDALAIAAFLQSLPAVRHAVAGPFGPGQPVTVPVMAVIPPSVWATLPKPPPPKQ
jgi:mono/diheme cytochrome c family protein